MVSPCAETKMSIWWNFHHWLHRKLLFWQLLVQPVSKIFIKMATFLFQRIRKSAYVRNASSICTNTRLIFALIPAHYYDYAQFAGWQCGPETIHSRAFCWTKTLNVDMISAKYVVLIFLFVNMIFEMSTVHWQQHLFLTHERMFLRKSRFICRMFYHLSYWGQTFALPCFGILALMIYIYIHTHTYI